MSVDYHSRIYADETGFKDFSQYSSARPPDKKKFKNRKGLSGCQNGKRKISPKTRTDYIRKYRTESALLFRPVMYGGHRMAPQNSDPL